MKWSNNPGKRAAQWRIIHKWFTDKENMTAQNTPRDIRASGAPGSPNFGLGIDTDFGAFAFSLTPAQAAKVVDGLADAVTGDTLLKLNHKRGLVVVNAATLNRVGTKGALVSGPSSPWRIVDYNSSAIDQTAYNATTKELYVLFKRNRPSDDIRITRYVEVPPSIVRLLENSPSIGAAYNQLIKGQYPSMAATKLPTL